MVVIGNISDGVNGDIQPKAPESIHRINVILIDDPLSKIKFGCFNYFTIIVSGVILFVVALETVGISYIMPFIMCDLDLTTGQKGFLAGAAFFGVICSSHLWGFLADTRGRHRIIQPTLFITCFLTISCSFVQNFYVFTALRFLSGFFVSGSAANIFAYLGEFHSNAHRSRAIMGSAIVYSSSCMMIPLAAWAVVNQQWRFEIPIIGIIYKPWRLYLVVCSIPGLISALIMFILPESPKFLLEQGNVTGAQKVLQQINRWNNGEKSEFEEFAVRQKISAEAIQNPSKKHDRTPLLTTVWNQTAPLFKPPFLRATIIICMVQFTIYAISNGFFMFLAEILNRMSVNLDSFFDQRMMMCDIINMEPDNGSQSDGKVCIDKLELSTLENGFFLEVIFTVGSVIAGLLINRVGKLPIIVFVLFTTGISGIGCMLIDIPALQVSMFLWHLSCNIAANVVSSATVDLYPTSFRAMAVSISLMFGRLGGVAGSNTVAFLLDNQCETSFYLGGSLLLAMSALTFFIPREYPKDSYEVRQKNDRENVTTQN